MADAWTPLDDIGRMEASVEHHSKRLDEAHERFDDACGEAAVAMTEFLSIDGLAEDFIIIDGLLDPGWEKP